MDNEPRFCIRCKHHVAPQWVCETEDQVAEYLCKRNQYAGKPCLVTGHVPTLGVMLICLEERSGLAEGCCGPLGQYFEGIKE